MRYHHEPGLSDGNQLAFIVHTANYIAQQCGIGTTKAALSYELDPKALDFLALDGEDLEKLYSVDHRGRRPDQPEYD